MYRIILFLALMSVSVCAQDVTNGYLAVSEGGDRDPAVVEFLKARDREYFEKQFVAEAPHTKFLAASSTAVKCRWHFIGYLDGKAMYDLFHTIEAFGGEWAVKTVLIESKKDLFRPVFSRKTQPAQWPVHDTFTAYANGEFLLVDRFLEHAKIRGPYGSVIRRRKTRWVVEDYTKYPSLYKFDSAAEHVSGGNGR